MTGLTPAAGVALGIIVGLLSTCVQSIGLTLQRKSHMLEDEKEDEFARRPPYRRRRWQVGMFLFLIANIVGSSIQITTLPLPLLSTLQASGLVFNSLLASLLLREKWTWRSAYGTVLVAAGAVLISYFSVVPEPSHNLQQLLELLGQVGFLLWFILSLVFVLAVLATTFALRFCVPQHLRESPRIFLINGMAFGLVSGILSAHALLLAKSAVELIVRSLADHKNQFKSYQPWLLVLAFLALSLSQLYYLHHGLKLISTSILYPFVFCVYNIVAILDGLIYFRQMDRLAPLQAGLIALGTVLLLSGVLALSWRLQGDDEDQQKPAMVKAEIPQTVLAPGMGFVGEPDSESNDTDSERSEDDAETNSDADERSTLIRKSPHRSSIAANKSPSLLPSFGHVNNNKRRHRAATLKEMKDIWDALGDSGDRYGTFDEVNASSASKNRSVSTGNVESRTRRRSSAGKSITFDNEDDEELAVAESGLQRSSTMPNPRRSRSRRRRKSSHYSQGSALFSDLLKMDWWRTRRKQADGEEPSSPHSPDGHDVR